MPQQLKTCRRITDDDEFYTRYRDAVRGLHCFIPTLKGKRVICPCDTNKSNIYLFLKDVGVDVRCAANNWKAVDYSLYDIVITNPPFKEVREMLKFFANIKKDFIILVSDVLRYSISLGKFTLPVSLWRGRDAQKFLRPDGTEKPVHCGWISTFKDSEGCCTPIILSKEKREQPQASTPNEHPTKNSVQLQLIL